MPNINSKVKQLYDALKADGGDVGSEQEFNDWFFASGEEGYKNRKYVYDTFKADGADIGANYEEFRDWLGLRPAPAPTKKVQKAPDSGVGSGTAAPYAKRVDGSGARPAMQAARPTVQAEDGYIFSRAGLDSIEEGYGVRPEADASGTVVEGRSVATQSRQTGRGQGGVSAGEPPSAAERPEAGALRAVAQKTAGAGGAGAGGNTTTAGERQPFVSGVEGRGPLKPKSAKELLDEMRFKVDKVEDSGEATSKYLDEGVQEAAKIADDPLTPVALRASAREKYQEADAIRKANRKAYDDAHFGELYGSHVQGIFDEEKKRGEAAADAATPQLPAVAAPGAQIAQGLRSAEARERYTDPERVMNKTLKRVMDDKAFTDYVFARMGIPAADATGTVADKDSAGEPPSATGEQPPLSEREQAYLRALIAKESGEVADQIQSQMMAQYKDEMAPKSVLDYIGSKAVHENFMSTLADAAIRRAAGSSGLRQQLRAMGSEEFGKQAGWGVRVLGGAAPFAVDMLSGGFSIPNAVGSAVTRGGMNIAAKQVAKRAAARAMANGVAKSTAEKVAKEVGTGVAERFLATQAPILNVALRAMGGAANFATYDVQRELARQLGEGEFSPVDIIKEAAHGAVLGGVMGVAGGAIGQATAKSGAMGKVLGDVAGIGAETGIFAASSAIEQAIADGVSVMDVDWGSALGESLGMVLGMKGAGKVGQMLTSRGRAELLNRYRKSPDYDLKLNEHNLEDLRSAGYDLSDIFHGLRSMGEVAPFTAPRDGGVENVRRGDRAVARQGENAEVEYIDDAALRRLLDSKDISSDTKRKVMYLATGNILSPEPVFGADLTVDDDGRASVTTYNAVGDVVDVKDYKSEADAREAYESRQRESRVNTIMGLVAVARQQSGEMEDLAARARQRTEESTGKDVMSAIREGDGEVMDAYIKELQDAIWQKQNERLMQLSVDAAEHDGYEMGGPDVPPSDLQDVEVAYSRARDALMEEFGEDNVSWIDRLGAEEVSEYHLGLINGGYDEAARKLLDYVRAKSRRDGVFGRVRDDINEAIETSNATVDERTGKDGMVRKGILKVDDEEVYIVDGAVVMNDDGSGVDVEASKQANGGDGMVVVVDGAGEKHPISVDDLLRVDEGINANDEKEAAATEIQATMAQAAVDKLNGVVPPLMEGDAYELTDGEGTKIAVQVTGRNEDGTYQAVIGGRAYESVDLQMMADDFAQERAERQSGQMEPEAGASGAVESRGNGIAAQNEEAGMPGRGAEAVMPGQGAGAMTQAENIRGGVDNAGGEAGLEATGDAGPSAPTSLPGDAGAMNGEDDAGAMNGEDDDAMPMIGEGDDAEPDFGKVTPSRARTYIYDEAGLSDEEADQFVEANKKAADKALADAKKKSPKMGTSLAKYKKEQAAYQAKVAAAQAQADYWADVKKEQAHASGMDLFASDAKFSKEMKAAQEELKGDREALRMLTDLRPRSLDELAAQMLAGGTKLLLNDEEVNGSLQRGVLSHTGFSRQDVKRMPFLFASHAKGGVSVEQLAHMLYENASAEDVRFDSDDANAPLDAVIEVLSSVGSQGDINHYIERKRIAEAISYHNEMERQREEFEEMERQDAAVRALTGMGKQEYDSYISSLEERLAQQAEYENSQAYFDAVDKYLTTFAAENNNQHDRETESDAGSRGEAGSGEVQREDGDPSGTAQDAPRRAGEDGSAVSRKAYVKGEVVAVLDDYGVRHQAEILGEDDYGDVVCRIDGTEVAISRADLDLMTANASTSTSPTDGQKQAGNYKKGHLTIDGLDISIENPAGSVRSGKDADGKEWSQTMHNSYGYIRRTEGVDGDHIDVFLGELGNWNGMVYVVDQVNRDGSFDEHKVMYGFNSAEEARDAYLSNYEEGWQGLGAITAVSKEEFKRWIDSSHRKTKPFSEYKGVRTPKEGAAAEQQPTQNAIQGLDGYTEDDVKALVRDHVESVLGESGADAEIVDIKVIGSRMNGQAADGSDLDVLVEYRGSAREDDLFNALNEESSRLYIDGIAVDINPITKGKSGTIEEFLRRNKDYKKGNNERVEMEPQPGRTTAGDGVDRADTTSKDADRNIAGKRPVQKTSSSRQGDGATDTGQSSVRSSSETTDAGDGTADRSVSVERERAVINREVGGQGLSENVQRLMDAYRKWGQDVLGKDSDKRDDTLYDDYADAKRSLSERLKTMSDQELDTFGEQYSRENDPVADLVKEERKRRAWSASVETAFIKGLESQDEIAGTAKAPKVATDSFTSRDVNRPVMNGVYHAEEGYAVATDGKILVADKSQYDKDNKGKIIATHKVGSIKKGDAIPGKYPNWRAVANGLSGSERSAVTWDGLRDFLAGAEELLKERWKEDRERNSSKESYASWSEPACVAVRMPNGEICVYTYSQLRAFADAAASMGMKEVSYGDSSPLKATNDKGIVMLMPVSPRYITEEEIGSFNEDRRLYYEWDAAETESPSAVGDGDGSVGERVEVYRSRDGKEIAYQSLLFGDEDDAQTTSAGAVVTNKAASAGSDSASARDAIESMTDGELLQAIADNEERDRGFHIDEYDKRHQQEYDDAVLSYAQMLEQDVIDGKGYDEILDNAYSLYADVSRRWRDGGYATDERTALRAQLVALETFIDFIESEKHDLELDEERERELEEASRGFDEEREAVREVGFNPAELRLRPLEDGEVSYVERRYEENKQFSFTGKEKIESAADVAYIFKQLETSSVENTFMVLLKDGTPTILHLSMGGYDSAMAPIEQAVVAYEALKPDKVVFVHNHPSGMLKASRQDAQLLQRVVSAFGKDVVAPGLIIDTTSGKYGEFLSYGDEWEGQREASLENEVSLKVYNFSKNVFSEGWNPLEAFQAGSSSSIAAFISSHRLGKHKKMSMLVLSPQNRVVGNVFLPWTSMSELMDAKATGKKLQEGMRSLDDAGRLMSGYINQMGGVRGLLYGSYDYDKDIVGMLNAHMKALGTPLLDVLHIKDDGDYTSASERGVMESTPEGSVWADEPVTGTVARKEAQLDLILQHNPADDANMPGHVWIRSVDDIKTFDEAIAEADRERRDGGWSELASYPDITNELLDAARRTGRITVYSSHSIQDGAFVTPSQMQAKDYAGEGRVYKKNVSVGDVAWINVDEGQYAQVASSPKADASGTVAESEAFYNGLNSDDEVYNALEKEMSSRDTIDIINSLESYYGGELKGASSGAANAIANGLVPVAGPKGSGTDGEYHHLRFASKDGESKVVSVPFVEKEERQSQVIFDTAKAHFGTTKDFREAGYLLPDGSLLDFSGRHEGGDETDVRGHRHTDHRVISSIAYRYDENGEEVETGVETDMPDFIRRGAIRIDNNYGFINLHKAPTDAQIRVLKRYIREQDGYVSVDFGDGWDSDHYVDYNAAKPQRVLSDIDKYFTDGIKPIGDDPNDDLRFSDGAPVYYSNAARAVEGIKQEKATPEQWLKMIEKGGGLKAGEDKWLGLSEWLKEQANTKRSLTRDEILDFIRSNQIQVEEVGYAESEFNETAARKLEAYNKEFRELVDEAERRKEEVGRQLISLGESLYEKYGEGWYNRLDELDEADRKRYQELESLYSELDNPSDWALNEMAEWYGDDFRDGFEVQWGGAHYELVPQHDMWDEPTGAALHYLEDGSEHRTINSTRLSYTTNGLDNRREIALVVPTIEPWNRDDDIHFGDAGEGRAVAWIRFGQTTIHEPSASHEAARKALYDYQEKLAKKYGFDTNDVLSWDSDVLTREESDQLARLELDYEDSFKDGSDKKVLVIDEIQSKRHQEGREKGYRGRAGLSPATMDDLDIDRSGDLVAVAFKPVNQRFMFTHDKSDEEILAAINETIASGLMNEHLPHIPDAPFDKNWHELAMKRMLRYAAENGYDKVAWTKGEQQAERYNIGNAVDRIISYDYPATADREGRSSRKVEIRLKDGDTMTMRVNSEGRVIEGRSDTEGKQLADVVGKDLAMRIMNGEGKDGTMYDANRDLPAKIISGDGLRIGGEGMKGFYDQILPRFMDKYGKKWGVKVGEVELPEVEEAGRKMWSVDVTPEMRDSVMQGQPMFRKGEGAQQMDGRLMAIGGRSRRQVAAYQSRARRQAARAAEAFAKDLHLDGVEVVTDLNDAPDSVKAVLRRRPTAKGWFDPQTNKIVVVVPNHGSADDVIKTLLHEGVAHYGLRRMFGEHFDVFLDNVYENAELGIKSDIGSLAADLMSKDGGRSRARHTQEWYRRTATEEYLAGLAEDTNFEKPELQSWWQKVRNFFLDMLAKVGAKLKEIRGFGDMYSRWTVDMKLTDNELRYILWRSYENLKHPGRYKGILAEAEDVAKQVELGVRIGGERRGGEGRGEAAAYAKRRAERAAGEPPSAAAEGRGAGAAEGREVGDELFRDDGPEGDASGTVADGDGEGDELSGVGGRESLDEVLTHMNARLAQQHKDNLQLRIDAMHAIGGNLSKLRRAMSQQRKYDQETVNAIVRQAKMLMDTFGIDVMTRGEVKKLAGLIAGAAGKEDIMASADAVLDGMIVHHIRSLAGLLNKQVSVRGSKIDAKGVEIQGQLDIEGQRMITAMREGMGMSRERLNERITDVTDRMGSDDSVTAKNAATEMAGLQFAKQYLDEIKESQEEEQALKRELRDAREARKAARKAERERGAEAGASGTVADGASGEVENSATESPSAVGLSREAWKQYVKETEEAIRANRIERIEAYERLLRSLGSGLGESVERAKAFQEAATARVREIQHNANSDLQGVTNAEHRQATWLDKLPNNSLARLFMKPLATFDQMLRFFGSKSVDGRGYLFERFMTDYTRAHDREWKSLRRAHETLDAKVKEVFGRRGETYTNKKGEAKALPKLERWSDLFSLERKMPGMDVTMFDAGQERTYTLTQGNLLYLYMVNKMVDGRMKLRRMGINEDDIAAITDFLDPRFVELADWVQDEFLVQKREEYNEVYERMFGAPMAAIENYFPLKINSRSRGQAVDLGDESYLDDNNVGSTITGSVIKRTKNSLPLDIHADAFDVLLGHLQDMEHWAAFGEFNRDLSALLSYRRFRNQVLNMSSVRFGSGKTLWQNFKRAAAMSSGAYRPKIDRDGIDTSLVNVAKGVTAAKIALRVYTAIKQLLSYPAYLSEASVMELAKTTLNPKDWVESWQWAMSELPGFAERWQSRQAGDSRLRETDVDWQWWKNQLVQAAQRIGMTPNAAVDAFTVVIGARAIYKTAYNRYKQQGFSDERANEKALRDASISYNETQQSSENAYLSTIQLDRTFASVGVTVFRNASMGYERRFAGAVANLKRKARSGYKDETVQFMAKQLYRELCDDRGLAVDWDSAAEDEAASRLRSHCVREAEKMYRRSFVKDIIDCAVFGFVLQFAWNLGSSLPYLFFGNDDDEKDAIMEEAAVHALAGPIEGLTGGQLMSEVYNLSVHLARTDDKQEAASIVRQLSNYQLTTLPLLSDLQSTMKKFATDDIGKWNDVVNLIIQSGVGVNPQTISDAAMAVYDAFDGDAETSREFMFMMMRIMQFPQSNLDMMYVDELGMFSHEAKDLPLDELARRWARYKRLRNNPLSGLTASDEAITASEEKLVERFKKKVEERLSDMEEEELREVYERSQSATERKLISKAAAKLLGGKDPYGSSKTSYNARYTELRSLEDLWDDMALYDAWKQAKDSGDDERASALHQARADVTAIRSELGSGNDAEDARLMQELREARATWMKELDVSR